MPMAAVSEYVKTRIDTFERSNTRDVIRPIRVDLNIRDNNEIRRTSIQNIVGFYNSANACVIDWLLLAHGNCMQAAWTQDIGSYC